MPLGLAMAEEANLGDEGGDELAELGSEEKLAVLCEA